MKLSGLFLFFLLFSCNEKKKFTDCKKYQVGSFVYKSRLTDQTLFIQRGNMGQIETDSLTGKKQEQIIDWIDDCSYKLREVVESQTDPSGATIGIVTVDQNRKTFEIIKGTDKYYICRTIEKGHKSYHDTVWVNK